jgi:cardiolipin synthase (CMP-forming)
MQAGHDALPAIWRNTPNAISIARLCATAVLLAAVFQHQIDLFKWLLLACLLSDILDGLIARTFHLASKLGAALDSAADMLTMLIGFVGVYVFQRAFVAEHYAGLLTVAVFYIAEIFAALARYGRLSSFHTLLDRVAAYAGGIFVMSLFLWGYHGWLFQLTVLVYVVSLTEEMILICILPEWKTDVGNIFRMLAAGRRHS